MKHKHYDMIVAWAEGKQIQFNALDNNWEPVGSCPIWVEDYEYRIKPEPKPDFFTYSTIMLGNTGIQSSVRYGSDNVKFTYDGETRKLKSAEVI
jgi:hypothetical protein